MEDLAHTIPEQKEKEAAKLFYHHARPLEACVYNIVYPKSPVELGQEDADFWEGAYRWLENEVGFYPLFIAVGQEEEDLRMTGYQNQWRRLVSRSLKHREYRNKGDFPNYALFSFSEFPQGIFTDFDNWVAIVLNRRHENYQMSEREKQMIFRPSWIKNDWISFANRNPGAVQLVVPSLDLRKANRVYCRNKASKRTLEQMGFPGVDIFRLKPKDFV